jgi:hypothetical protein
MQWRKVSAVIIYTNLVIANARDQEPWIGHNPWATTPLPFDLLPLSQLVPDRTRNTMSKKDGEHCSLYLDLPVPWPPNEVIGILMFDGYECGHQENVLSDPGI